METTAAPEAPTTEAAILPARPEPAPESPAVDEDGELLGIHYEYVAISSAPLPGTSEQTRRERTLAAKEFIHSLDAVGLVVTARSFTDKSQVFLYIGINDSVCEEHAQAMGLEMQLIPQHGGAFAKFTVAAKDHFLPFTSTQRQRVVLDLIEGDKDLGCAEINTADMVSRGVYKSFFALHDTDALEDLSDRWLWRKLWHPQPIDDVAKYYGEEVAFYFSWLGFYTRWIGYSILVGLVLFITSYAIKDDYGWSNTIYSVFIAIWGAVFLEAWKRESNKNAYKWNMTDFEDVERINPAYIGEDLPGVWRLGTWVPLDERKEGPVHKLKYFPQKRTYARMTAAFSVIAVLAIMVIIAGIAILTFRLFVQRRLVSITGIDLMSSVGGVMVSVVNAAFIMIFNKIYTILARIMNNWENHRTIQSYNANLAVKVFLFTFVNTNTSLFYIAYAKRGTALWGDTDLIDACDQQSVESDETSLWYGCPSELTQQLASLLLFNLFVGQATELLSPFIMPYVNTFLLYARRQESQESGSAWAWPFRMIKYLFQFAHWRRFLSVSRNLKPEEAEATLNDYPGMIDEYAEMALHFGLVTMFAAAFPLAPLIAFVNNVIEMRTDAYKFVRLYHKPNWIGAHGIGVWYYILQAIANMAVVNNCLLIGFMYLPIKNIFMNTTHNDKWQVLYWVLWTVVILEHVIFLIRMFISVIIPDVPGDVRQAQAYAYYLREVREKKLMDKVNKFKAQSAEGSLIKRRVLKADAILEQTHKNVVEGPLHLPVSGEAINEPLLASSNV